MLVLRPNRSTMARLLTSGLIATAIGVCAPAPASAHFILKAPAATLEQDGLGSPQKAPPCGDDGSAVPSGMVTAYQMGQQITVTIDEKIYHPGHYRISIGTNGPGDLPVEPIVTPGANTPCGSAPIDKAPKFPVLADGVFEHTAPFPGPQSITLTLPAGVTCDHCTLQVLEFMSNHGLNDPGGCYYHHCSDISISGGSSTTGATTGTGSTTVTGATSTSAGTGTMTTSTGGAGGAGGTTASGGPANESSGCDFSAANPGGSALTGLAGLAALVAFSRRRRRQS